MPKVQEINPEQNDYIKGYVIELKPSFLELMVYRIRAFFKYVFSYEVDEETGEKYHRAPRETADFSITTKDFSITWIGRDKYSLMIKRSPVVYKTNVEADKITMSDTGEIKQ